MGEYLRLLRFYFWLLGLFTVGRWALGFAGVEYSKAHHVFSLVILSLIASAHHGAFARAFQGFRLKQALGLGLAIGLSTQIVIFVSTVLSYAFGLQTYFNEPQALNSPTPLAFAAAVGARTITLVANCVTNTIAAGLGWAMGAGLSKARSA